MFIAPTADRVMRHTMEEGADLASLRAAVSAGETPPAPANPCAFWTGVGTRLPRWDRQAGGARADRVSCLADKRQTISGDSFARDANGRLHFAARNGNMINSAGHNLAAPKVEAARALHSAVVGCAVIGAPA